MILKGKRAVITGGTSGIGLATAILFRQNGARVAVTGRDANRLQRASEALGAGGLAVSCDSSSLSEIKSAFERMAGDWDGAFDILFVNAGIAMPAPAVSVSEEFIDATFATNFKGAFFSIQQALPYLKPEAVSF